MEPNQPTNQPESWTLGDISESWLTLAEVAEQQGVTTEAIRKRIKSGKIEALKVKGRWRIIPELDEPNQPNQPTPTNTNQQKPTGTRDGGATLREVVEAQRAHIESLERELDQRNAELRSFHLQIERLTAALPAPEDNDASMGKHQSGQSKPRWWQRRPRK